MRYAALIILNLPFALIGGIAALWLTGEYLSVPASVGFINLFGVAVLNGIVLVSYINKLRAEGMDGNEAVVTGCSLRLRPVLMTAVVALLGLLPLALSHGIGSEVQRPLAIVVIGGLVSSTLLTLIVLPVLYQWFDRPAAPLHPWTNNQREGGVRSCRPCAQVLLPMQPLVKCRGGFEHLILYDDDTGRAVGSPCLLAPTHPYEGQ